MSFGGRCGELKKEELSATADSIRRGESKAVNCYVNRNPLKIWNC